MEISSRWAAFRQEVWPRGTHGSPSSESAAVPLARPGHRLHPDPGTQTLCLGCCSVCVCTAVGPRQDQPPGMGKCLLKSQCQEGEGKRSGGGTGSRGQGGTKGEGGKCDLFPKG